jgi:hypothetical protein
MSAELGLAVRMNDRTMQSHMWDAHRLATTFHATLSALAEGRISRAHVSAILDTGGTIDEPAARAAFERTVLEYAETTTAARTRAYARAQADVLHPRTMQERHDAALQGRRVWVDDLDDGMSLLHQLLPTVVAHAVLDRTTRQAKLIKQTDATRRQDVAAAKARQARGDEESTPAETDRSGSDSAGRETGGIPDDDHDLEVWFDERTIDQIRADLVADMLLTGSPMIDPTFDAVPGGLGAIRAHVQITVPVTTLTGVTSGGAELDGIGPVDPETARRLAGEAAGWDRVMTDPVTGIVLAVDRYQPTAAQRRFLNARDRHCRMPGCRRPARQCDHDHTLDHAVGGRTDIRNLACLCKRHHTLKHATEWTVSQLRDGTLEFVSPAGRSYRDAPTPRVVFLPSEEPVAPF